MRKIFLQCLFLGYVLIKQSCSFGLLDNSVSCQLFFLTWYILTFSYRNMSNSNRVQGSMLIMGPDNTVI